MIQALYNRAYDTELDPTQAQRAALVQHVNGARVAHNWVLEQWRILDAARMLAAGVRALAGHATRGGDAANMLEYALSALIRGKPTKVRTPSAETEAEGCALSAAVVPGILALYGRHASVSPEPQSRYRYRAPRGAQIPDFRASTVDWYSQITHKRDEEPERFGWLTALSAFAVREAVLDVEDGWKHFFEHIKAGRYSKAGTPRFRRRTAAHYHMDQPDPIRVTDRAVKIPGIGWVRLKERGYLPATEEKSHRFPGGGKAIGLGLSESDGRWYVALRCSVPRPLPQKRGPGRALREHPTPRVPGRRMGVENGVRVLAVGYDGESTDVVTEEGLRDDARIQKLVMLRKRWERRMARRARLGPNGWSLPARDQSKGWHEAAQRIRHYHARITQLRDDRTAKIVRKITDRGAETLLIREPHVAALLDRNTAPDARARNALAPAVHGARMGDLRRRLEYKQEWAGGKVVLVDKFEPVTKRCSECGAVRDAAAAYPNFKCPKCGHVEDRDDANAPKNLQSYSGGNPGEADPRSADPKPPKGDNARRKRTARAADESPSSRLRTAPGTGPAPEPPPQAEHSNTFTMSSQNCEHVADTPLQAEQGRSDTAAESRRSRKRAKTGSRARGSSTRSRGASESTS